MEPIEPIQILSKENQKLLREDQDSHLIGGFLMRDRFYKVHNLLNVGKSSSRNCLYTVPFWKTTFIE